MLVQRFKEREETVKQDVFQVGPRVERGNGSGGDGRRFLLVTPGKACSFHRCGRALLAGCIPLLPLRQCHWHTPPPRPASSPLRPRPPIPATAPHKQAYVDLLRQVGLAARRSDGATTGLLRADIPSVMRAVARQLKHKSAKTKVSSISVVAGLKGSCFGGTHV